jgi:hypothetical protein
LRCNTSDLTPVAGLIIRYGVTQYVRVVGARGGTKVVITSAARWARNEAARAAKRIEVWVSEEVERFSDCLDALKEAMVEQTKSAMLQFGLRCMDALMNRGKT